MAYNKAQVQEAADALWAVIQAARDGIQAEDMGAAVMLLTSIASVADNAKDTDAFVAHLASRLLDHVGDELVDAEVSE